ncbi:DUF4235 domain-containing protein [Sporichthya brevicatena]|uniref:DUF4235 domain-containing protein n=1 Tax=Sporichthya brevicatena TaxID=171442 RepID=UPI0031D5DEB3
MAESNNVAWKAVATGGAVAATFVTRKAVAGVWKAATGGAPPEHPENPDTTWAQALAWAMLTGAVAGAVRLLITRKAASSWRAATGQLPPGLTTS